MRVVIALIGLFLPSLCLAHGADPAKPLPPPAATALIGLEDVVVLVLGIAAGFCVWRLGLWRVEATPRPMPPASPPPPLAIPHLLLLGLLVWVGHGLAGAVFTHLWGPPARTDPTLRQLGIVAVPAYLAAIVLAAVLISALGGWPGGAIGVRPSWSATRKGVWSAFLILPLVAGTGVLVSLLWTTLTGSPPPTVAHDTLELLAAGPMASSEADNRGVWWWLVVASVVLGAPFLEELIYRGFLQTATGHAARSRATGVIITSLVFTGVHMGIADFRALPLLFVLSLGMGVCYERTGRLLTPIVVHAAFNAANVATAVLQNSP